MSLSEDEDDFLSADEEDYTCKSSALAAVQSTQLKKQSVDARIRAEEEEIHRDKQESCNIPPKEVIEENIKAGIVDKEPQEVAKVAGASIGEQQKAVSLEEDDDDEESLAERIRERNLKIARKFSAEIAKNVKASAPIPVKLAPPQADYNVGDNDFQNSPGQLHPILPPAPPSTPALSSSFNNNSESSPIVNTMTALSAAANTISQYGWRIPSSVRGVSEPRMASSTAATCSSSSPQAKTSDPARSALDRLSEKLSKPEKNLFEMVAEDIKKVTLKPTTTPKTTTTIGDESQQGIPLISDIGNMLGGWNWNSASQLLASATQVTSQMTSQVGSQVGSVIDSVVQKANPQAVGNQFREREGFDENK